MTVEAPLSAALVAQYDAAAALWTRLRLELEAAHATAAAAVAAAQAAAPVPAGGNSAPRDTWTKAYWSAHQRFFKLMCIGLKMDTVIAEVGKDDLC